jgi:hypothetical protein
MWGRALRLIGVEDVDGSLPCAVDGSSVEHEVRAALERRCRSDIAALEGGGQSGSRFTKTRLHDARPYARPLQKRSKATEPPLWPNLRFIRGVGNYMCRAVSSAGCASADTRNAAATMTSSPLAGRGGGRLRNLEVNACVVNGVRLRTRLAAVRDASFQLTQPPSKPGFSTSGRSASALTRKRALMQRFLKPSDGLEPSTPSLPFDARGNHSQPTATDLACFRVSAGGPFAGGCHWLRLLGSINAPSSRRESLRSRVSPDLRSPDRTLARFASFRRPATS